MSRITLPKIIPITPVKQPEHEVVYETTISCDCCGKKSSADTQIRFGGCNHHGFIVVSQNISLAERIGGVRESWDFCSFKCMIEYFKKEEK